MLPRYLNTVHRKCTQGISFLFRKDTPCHAANYICPVACPMPRVMMQFKQKQNKLRLRYVKIRQGNLQMQQIVFGIVVNRPNFEVVLRHPPLGPPTGFVTVQD